VSCLSDHLRLNSRHFIDATIDMEDCATNHTDAESEQLGSPSVPVPQDADRMDVDLAEWTAPQPKKPMASLLKQAESAALKFLSDAIGQNDTTSRYCCGGRVAPSLNSKVAWEALEDFEPDSVHRASSLHLNNYILRYDDPAEKGISRQVQFPMEIDNDNEVLRPLINATQTSGGLRFLSPKQFSIDFDPHRSGLLDVVAQILLPGFECDVLESRPEHRGIRASHPTLLVVPESTEKVKIPLNHAQSPPNTLGKLLVRLPTAHQGMSTSPSQYSSSLMCKGGQWEITETEDKTSTIFNWTYLRSVQSTLQWAAARASSKVIIHPNQSAPQLILLYNLVVSERVGGLLLHRRNSTKCLFTNPSHFPLYDSVKNLLESPGFMKEGLTPYLSLVFIADTASGGRLGVYCRYSYSHTSLNAKNVMPCALQGIDVVLYSTFRTLGLKPEVRPLLDPSTMEDLVGGWDDMYASLDDVFYQHEKEDYKQHPLRFAELLGFEREEMEKSGTYPDFLSYEEWKRKKANASRVGMDFHPLRCCETGDGERSSRYSFEQTVGVCSPPISPMSPSSPDLL
jgi:hypothetical protein